jgi:hypothetical protein
MKESGQPAGLFNDAEHASIILCFGKINGFPFKFESLQDKPEACAWDNRAHVFIV